MEDCEICGNSEARFIVLIEGAKLGACGKCARGGQILSSLYGNDEVQEQRIARKVEEEEIVEGYGKIIKKARENTNLPIKELARKINESEGFLDHIEKEKMRPTIKVAKKLEKELGIKLIEKTTDVSATPSSKKTKFTEPTLADLLEKQK